MSNMDQIQQLMALASAGTPLDLGPIATALAQRISAAATREVAEAKELLGDDAEKYIPVNRDYYRNQREALRLEHEREMHKLALEQRRIEVDNLKAISLQPQS